MNVKIYELVMWNHWIKAPIVRDWDMFHQLVRSANQINEEEYPW